MTRLATTMLALLAGSAAHAKADSLLQAWQLARANDPAFAAAAAELRGAATAAPAAMASLLPQFSLSAAAGPQKQYFAAPEFYGSGFEPITETQKLGVSSWNATLTQTLFNWSAFKNYQASGFSVEAAAENFQATLEALNLKLVTAYVGVAQATADLAAVNLAASGFAHEYNNAEARYRAGVSGIISADEALAADSSIAVQQAQAQESLAASQQALAALTSVQSELVEALPDSLSFPPQTGVEEWIARAALGNPVLAGARATNQSNADLVSAAKGRFLPDVSLQLQHENFAQGGSASYAFQGEGISGPGNSLQQDNSITVQMTWNIFSGGADHAALDQAEAEQDQSADQARSAALHVIQAVRTNYADLLLDQVNLTAARTAATASQAAVIAAGKGVMAGLIGENDLIEDRQQLLSAQIALHAVVSTAITHELALAQAAGSATPGLIQSMSLMLSNKEQRND